MNRYLNLEAGTLIQVKVTVVNPLKIDLKIDKVEVICEQEEVQAMKDSFIVEGNSGEYLNKQELIIQVLVKEGPLNLAIRGLRIYSMGTYCEHFVDKRGIGLLAYNNPLLL